MSVKMQHYIKAASVLLAIAVLLAGQMPAATASGNPPGVTSSASSTG